MKRIIILFATLAIANIFAGCNNRTNLVKITPDELIEIRKHSVTFIDSFLTTKGYGRRTRDTSPNLNGDTVFNWVFFDSSYLRSISYIHPAKKDQALIFNSNKEVSAAMFEEIKRKKYIFMLERKDGQFTLDYFADPTKTGCIELSAGYGFYVIITYSFRDFVKYKS